MINTDTFLNRPLGGVFFITEIDLTHEPLEDALGREAIAQTTIIGQRFRLVVRSGLSDEELSITLYHEILEAATVASAHPPESVCGRWIRSCSPASPSNMGRGICGKFEPHVAILRISWRIRVMADHEKIQFDLVKLLNGERILRLTDPQSGLSLEKKLKPAEAVVRQKNRLLEVFEAALARAEVIGA
jgi:hypothetical protein